MATSRDIARVAGVSIGTVSKVINGASGVSSDKINRVKAAIKELGYTPNAFARHLKAQNAQTIDVILPTMDDRALAIMYACIYRVATAEGYIVNLHITYEAPHVETQILRNVLSYGSNGAILMTCQPDNKALFDQMTQAGLNLVFVQRRVALADFDSVSFNVENCFRPSLLAQKALGKQTMALLTGPLDYSFELECKNIFLGALMELDLPIRKSLLDSCAFDQCSAARATIRLLDQPDPPQVIYATSQLLSTAAKRVMDIVYENASDRPNLIYLGAYSWSTEQGPNNLALPYAEMGEQAFGLLLESIRGEERKAHNITLYSRPQSEPFFIAKPRFASSDTLRVLFRRDAESSALSLYLNNFERATGIRVEADFNNESNILRIDTLNDALRNNTYDAFTLDIPWLPRLIRQGALLNLSDYLTDGDRLMQLIPKAVLSEYGYVDGKLYAIPFNFTVEVLYYQNNLFQKQEYQRLYFEQNKKELKAPATWAEFNEIARFFTRRYNRLSPTEYGSALCWWEGAELLPRLWAYGALPDDDHLALSPQEGALALNNLLTTMKYSAPFEDVSWEEQAQRFGNGEVAMLVAYSDIASILEERTCSKVAGKYGVSIIPGRHSMLGGWSIGVNAHSCKIEQSLAFLNWLYRQDMLEPTAIQGRILPLNTLLQSSEISALSPFHKTILDAFSYVRKRPEIQNSKGELISSSEIFHAVDRIICQGSRDNRPAEDILRMIVQAVAAMRNA